MSLHKCQGALPESGYGSALDICFEDVAGKLWAANDEYGSQVNYCPYCGYKAKIQLRPDNPPNPIDTTWS